MHLKLSKGHDFRLSNHPSQEVIDVSAEASQVILHPLDFPYIKPKLLLKDGSEVNVGTPVFIDKLNPNIKFVSPVSGNIEKIEYGERRSIQSITINNDSNYTAIQETSQEAKGEEGVEKNILPMDKNSWINSLTESGLWTLIRQRPFSKIADPDSAPKSIFISLYDTRPYGCNPELVISSNKEFFNNGIKLLGKIADCPIHITAGRDFDLDLINIGNQRSCNIHSIEGPHPAGNVGVQIHHIDPILSKENICWYLDVNSLIDLGYFFDHKGYNPYKIISVCGEDLSTPNFRKIVKNQSLDSILSSDEIQTKNYRVISGDMLSGSEKDLNCGISNYDDMLTILFKDEKREFLGWINPGFSKYSLSNTFLSKLLSNLVLKTNSRLNGEKRSIISFGRWEEVLPMDIMPEELVKSILIEDLESMENLGIYECAEEDFALCSYVCQSKTEVSQIIKRGLELSALDV